MVRKISKDEIRRRIHTRIRNKVTGTHRVDTALPFSRREYTTFTHLTELRNQDSKKSVVISIGVN